MMIRLDPPSGQVPARRWADRTRMALVRAGVAVLVLASACTNSGTNGGSTGGHATSTEPSPPRTSAGPPAGSNTNALVTRAVDGDTIEVRFKGQDLNARYSSDTSMRWTRKPASFSASPGRSSLSLPVGITSSSSWGAGPQRSAGCSLSGPSGPAVTGMSICVHCARRTSRIRCSRFCVLSTHRS